MLIVYFGADAGCGCTMLAQSTANYAARKYPDKKILILSLSGYVGGEYAETEFNYGIDNLQVKLKSDVLTIEEVESMCSIRKNLYMLQGSRILKQRKEYMPEDITRLMKLSEKKFDYIIADAGCSVDLGMGLGALNCGGRNLLVTTQSQRAFTRHMQKENILKTLGIQFSDLIINKFISKHFLPSEKVVRDSYKFDKCSVIEYSDYGMQAEEEGNGLEHLDKAYKKQIEEILESIFYADSQNHPFILKHGRKSIFPSLEMLGGKRYE
ncbi:hypothetical protein [Aminipila sp.]|uniref:hypothetical protein n=1 Tax=Aminipila sp. TaxID=2060095 RepID=UPI0028995B9A|nr:hypothetical protein [Aminipila sp.]